MHWQEKAIGVTGGRTTSLESRAALGLGLLCAVLGACQCHPTCASANCAATFDEFTRSWAANACARSIACGHFDPARRSECEPLVTNFARWGDARASVMAGSRLYDATAGQQCLEATLHLDCGVRWLSPHEAPCAEVLRGAAGTGERCLSADDCVVLGDECRGAPCESTCQPSDSHVGVGTPCSPALPCDAGQKWQWCDRVLKTCQVPGAGLSGAECTDDVLGCWPGYRCEGLVAAGADGGTAGHCARTEVGGACLDSRECPLGTQCTDAGLCAPSNPCGPAGCVPPAVCMPNSDWSSDSCRVLLKESAPCPVGDGVPDYCLWPNRCYGHCRHAGALGEDCWGSACIDGACLGYCALKLPDGKSCSESSSCASGNCAGGLCRALCQ